MGTPSTSAPSSPTSTGDGDAPRSSDPGTAADAAFDGVEASLPTAFPEPTIQDGFSFSVGILVPAGYCAFCVGSAESAAAEIERLGGTAILLDGNNDIDRQVSQCDQLLAQDVDAIIVNPLDPAALGPCLRQAAEAGVPLIGNDTPPIAGDPLPEGYFSNVLQGTDRARYDLAKDAATKFPGAAFATIGTAVPVPILSYGMQQQQVWGELLGLEFLGLENDRDGTADASALAMNTVLSNYPDVEVVFCYNDTCAQAASTTARASGRSDIKVYGDSGEASALEMVRNGQLEGTILLDPVNFGIQLAHGVYDALTGQGGTLPEHVVIPATLVTKDNVDSVTPLGG